jgi:hypothetical protein
MDASYGSIHICSRCTDLLCEASNTLRSSGVGNAYLVFRSLEFAGDRAADVPNSK